MTQEIYALAENRSAQFTKSFLDNFLRERSAFAENYPIPECADVPTHICRNENEILSYLESHPNESYGLYWNAEISSSQVSQAMLFYTLDGRLILGLATSPNMTSLYLNQLQKFARTQYVMIGDEQRPPETSSEFITLCSQALRENLNKNGSDDMKGKGKG